MKDTAENQTRLLLESIKTADNGAVEYMVETKEGHVRGVIEQTFFDEFKAKNQSLTDIRKKRITQENADYIEEIARRQIRIGMREVVIK